VAEQAWCGGLDKAEAIKEREKAVNKNDKEAHKFDQFFYD
jgi:hypothetical protein